MNLRRRILGSELRRRILCRKFRHAHALGIERVGAKHCAQGGGGSPSRMRFIASIALLLTCACPSSAPRCADDSECAAAEVCVVAAGEGTCRPVSTLGDAGSLVDAGALDDAGPLVDAGSADGLVLRGGLEVAPGEATAGTKVLRGRVLGTGPATTVRGGPFVLDAAFTGANP